MALRSAALFVAVALALASAAAALPNLDGGRNCKVREQRAAHAHASLPSGRACPYQGSAAPLEAPSTQHARALRP